MALVGCGLGVGLLAFRRAGRTPRLSLPALMDAMNNVAPDGAEQTLRATPPWRLDQSLGRLLASQIQRRDLRGTISGIVAGSGRTLGALCSEITLGATVGTSIPILAWLVASAGGTQVSILVPICGAVLLGVCGATMPIVALARQNTKRRREERRVIGSFLDLVVLCLAGGMGVESALYAAAQVGQNDVSRRIARTLELARDSAASPWGALALLGEEMSLTELQEIAVAVGLAGTEGAQIRATLVAKAASVRQHELADAEAHANAATQRLFLPGVLLLLGFLLFIGFPAVERITSGI
jgi:tight adherence protein C